MSTKGKPAIGKPSRVDLNHKGQTLRKGAQVYPVGSDTVKSLLFGRLKHNEPGPGYIHFHAKTPLDYFEELTAEKQVLRYKNGFPQRVWVKKSSAPNEALDEFVYAYASLHRLYQLYDRRTIWDQLERKLRPVSGEAPTPQPRSAAAFNVLGR